MNDKVKYWGRVDIIVNELNLIDDKIANFEYVEVENELFANNLVD